MSARRELYVSMLERMLASCERLDAAAVGRVRPKVWARMIADTAAIRAKLERARTGTDPNENPAAVQLADWMGPK